MEAEENGNTFSMLNAITNFPLHFERSLEEIPPENYKKEAMKLEHLLQARKSPPNITRRCG